MDIITDKLNQRKIVLISLLKSKGINNSVIISQVLKGTKRSLNLIHAKHIKHSRINDKLFFKHLIKDKYFRKSFLLIEKIEIISTEINKLLVKRYSNNKDAVLFQDFIQYLLDLLLTFKNTHLSFDLYTHIKQNYKETRKVNVINATRLAGINTMKKLKLVNELIDAIDLFNFTHESRHNKLLHIRSYGNKNLMSYDEHCMLNYDYIQSIISNDKELSELFASLNIIDGKIENKLLYNKLIEIKETFRKQLYNIHYGTNYSDKASTSDPNDLTQVFKSSILPFHESGALEITDKQFNQLNFNTIFCNKSNEKFIKNLKNGYYNGSKINGSINVINEGINHYNKGKFNKSYFIHYQYVPSSIQQYSFKKLMDNLKQSCIYNKEYLKTDNFKDYVRCRYEYPYYNQRNNFKAFKQHFKENVQTNLIVHYNYVYPYANVVNAKRKKYLSFISWNNNAFKDYSLRKRINRNLANILYNVDLNRKITNFYKPKNQQLYTKRLGRIFLNKLITEIKYNYLSKFQLFLQSLMIDYKNRIYLFETYGINALVNQIRDLKIFYNNRFDSKRMKQAINTKKAIVQLESLIPLRNQYLEWLKMQRLTIESNIYDLRPSSILIQSILHENIEKYLQKSVIRIIDQPRSRKECIQLACNNIRSLYVDYMKSVPTYIKLKNVEYNKFDELLDDKDQYKIRYIDGKQRIDIIALFKCIIKFDRYLDLNDLYKDILDFKIANEFKLKDFIYKEKQILNA